MSYSKKLLIRSLFFTGLAVLFLTCFALLKRTVPFEIQTLLAKNHPRRIQYENDLKNFNDEASAWLLVKRDRPFSAAEIQSLSEQIGDYFEHDAAFEDVVGPQNAKYFEFEGSRFKLVPFLKDGQWTEQALPNLNEEFWQNSLVTSDFRSFLFSFSFRKDVPRADEKPAVDRIEKFLTQLKSENVNIQTAVLGAKIASAAFLREIGFQQRVITPILLIVLGLFFWACFRSWQIVAWSYFVMFVCYSLTLCLIILIEGGLGPYSSFALMFAFIVSTTDLIHFFGRFQQLKGSVEERLSKTFKIAYVPCLLTSLTTGAGFIALVVNQNLPIRFFGIYCAFSCLLEWAVIFWILPYLLPAFNFKPEKRGWDPSGLSNKVTNFVSKYAGAAVVMSSLIILVFMLTSFSLKIDDNFYTKFRQSHPLSKAIDLFSNEFNFVGSIDVIVQPKNEDFNSSQVLDSLRNFEADLKKSAVVSKLTSFRQVEDLLIKKIDQAKIAPSKRDDIRRSVTRLLLDYGTLNDLVNESQGTLRTTVFLKSLSSDDLNEVINLIDQLSKKYEAQLTIRPAGFSVIRSYINSRVIRDFFGSFLLSFVLIYACYLWLFRSFKWAFFALIPNALPLLAISGLMGLFKVPVDTNLVILICVVFGIAGDNTIHLSYVLGQERKSTASYSEALQKAWRLIGVAMIGTCAAFLFCLPVFLLGSLKLFSQIAIFLSVAFIAAFISDSIIFPAFQLKLGWGKQRKH